MKREGAFLRGRTINLHGICYYYCQKCFPPSAVSMKYAMCAQPNANKQVFPSQDWTIGTHGAVRLPRQPPKLRIKWRWKQQLPGEIHTANVFGLSLLLPYYPTKQQTAFLSGAWHSRCRMQKKLLVGESASLFIRGVPISVILTFHSQKTTYRLSAASYIM